MRQMKKRILPVIFARRWKNGFGIIPNNRWGSSLKMILLLSGLARRASGDPGRTSLSATLPESARNSVLRQSAFIEIRLLDHAILARRAWAASLVGVMQ